MGGVIAAFRITISLPASQSLKDKRQVVRSLRDRLRNDFGLSVAESGYQDKWQRAELLAVLAASDAAFAEQLTNRVRVFLDDFHLPLEVVDFESDVFPPF